MNSSNYNDCFPFGNDGISPPGKLSPVFAARPGFYYYDWDWELLPAVAGIVVLFVASSLKLLLLFLLASYPWPFEFIPPGSFVLFWDYPPVPTALTASVRDGPFGYWFYVPYADICVDLSYRAEVPLFACVIICYGFALLTPPPKYVWEPVPKPFTTPFSWALVWAPAEAPMLCCFWVFEGLLYLL
jgi:hypothetical protein